VDFFFFKLVDLHTEEGAPRG